MNGTKLLLFGISVVLFAGFGAVVEAVGHFFENAFFWVMLVGLVICFAGLLTDDSDERDETGSSDGPDDEDGPRDRDGPSGEGVEDDGDNEGEFERDPRYLPPNRFPPM